MSEAKLSKIAEKMQLKNFTENIDLDRHKVIIPDVNRPALQLNGFYEHFEKDRLQLIGSVEHAYMDKKTIEEKVATWDTFLSHQIPGVIYCRGFEPEAEVIELAYKYNVPLLGTNRETSGFMAELIYMLNEELAPMKTIHGVLVDVYGEGLLIIGESGIGKSEAALELVRRGHRLVADDVVEIRKINDHTLMGSSPATTQYLIELRGIGIIDVKSLYGVECVKGRTRIDLVIKLQEYKPGSEYDRLGLQDEYMDILGHNVTCHSLPIRPGRNLAVICETAAVNHRQKKMGYNAAQELYRRVQANIATGGKFGEDEE
ncbi:MAG TPA: HPr(Ser) kinase/phosphatase [Lachnospiraceae bacterium]|jgi:HPr kinase/phosphorylase|nr:HPr(Ser) kinase/phosphatase [Lachnospiraceae bacterium]MDD6147789.1 HPr(Ser) kinase/phosphatase [Lachnospiraceae bacterium]HAN50746.1 HPr(Ser) kinase/phosphatase [Lachnospiraceae bacterium]HBE07794.1 HPr(Ser) kinase/phosphatase [Lachnospiraceae bacterium]